MIRIVILFLCLLICLGLPAAMSAQTGTPNLILAEKARDLEDWDTAIIHFTKTIETGETKGNLLLHAMTYAHRCQAYFNKKKFELAIADCDKAIEIKPDMGYVYHLRGSSLRQTGKFDRAVADFTHAIQLDPKSPEHYVSRGIAYSDLGNRDQAIIDYGKAIELEPNEPDNYLARAMELRRKGDFDQAVTDYETAIKLGSNTLEAHIGLGLSYRAKRDYDRAITSFNTALKLDPRSTDALLFRGIAYSEKPDYDLAIKDYSEAIRLNPGFVIAYPIRGDAYVKKGNYRGAIADYTKRLQLEPDAVTLYARSWAHLYADDGKPAFDDAQKYLETNGLKNFGPYAVLVGYLGLRKSNKPAEAKAFAANSLKQTNAEDWPGKILRYVLGELSAEQLIKLAIDNDKLTEAHAYIGVMKIIGGDTAGGRTDLLWVIEKGNKNFAEYDLARAELSRIAAKPQ